MSRGKSEKLKLLVVDDETDNLDLLYRTFRRDFQVYKAESAPKALAILDEYGEMGIIISDQRMPEMNGTEFLSKTVDRFPNTIRILLTGYTDVEDLVDAINSGQVFKYITKPWTPEELKETVDRAAETYKVLKQRTNELSRALQRESVFNDIMRAIREEIDYRRMLGAIVESVGQNFAATHCILYPVEDNHLTPELFAYQAAEAEDDSDIAPKSALVQSVLETRQTQFDATDGKSIDQLAVPLTNRREQTLLAILALDRDESDRPWTLEDAKLIESVAEQAALALSQARLYNRTQELVQKMLAELEVARQIQSNLLRQSLPELERGKVQACCYPARGVGGDFFEVYVHPQGDVWLVLGDVSGKGVPAALFMASAISVMRRELAQDNPPDPEIVMQNLNAILSEDLTSNNCFITMVLARYTPADRQLVYANAGHIYPLVWHHRTVAKQSPSAEVEVEPQFLKTRGVPLGILPVWKAKSGTISLQPGDVFLLTSDGITEATVTQIDSNGQKKTTMLQQEGLWKLLQQEPSPLDLSHLLDRVRGDSQEQEDDQTILSLEVL
ncbi:MAG: response regulator [Cyanobacteria bacterium J055]|nr:MAG: response regulator [Cyanobacteria bacterium J055]